MKTRAHHPQYEAEPDVATELKAQMREWVFDRLADVAKYAGIAQDFLLVGDDRGAGYALAKTAVNLDHAVKAMAELQPANKARAAA